MKKFRITTRGTTYLTYFVDADSEEEARLKHSLGQSAYWNFADDASETVESVEEEEEPK